MPQMSMIQAITCRNCQVGKRRMVFGTYFTMARTELVTVPNIPAWKCDLCGWWEYDTRALMWLRAVLAPPESQARERKAPKQGRQEPGIGSERQVPTRK